MVDFSAIWKFIKKLFIHEHVYIEDDFLIIRVCKKCGDVIIDWDKF